MYIFIYNIFFSTCGNGMGGMFFLNNSVKDFFIFLFFYYVILSLGESINPGLSSFDLILILI